MGNKLVDISHQYLLPQGVKVFKVGRFGDNRGDLFPLFSNEDNVFGDEFKGIQQINMIKTKKDVLRGPHVCLKPQYKIVTVVKGAVTQVLRDLRMFGITGQALEYTIRHEGTSPIMVLIPPFVANALHSVSKATILYATDTYFDESLEVTVGLTGGQEWEYGDSLPLQSRKDEDWITVAQAVEKINEHNCN